MNHQAAPAPTLVLANASKTPEALTEVSSRRLSPFKTSRIASLAERLANSRVRPVKPDDKESTMTESVYKVIELVGTSAESWEKAASAAVDRASATLRDLRIAEVAKLDMTVGDGGAHVYRAKINVSFKYEDSD